MLRLLLSQLLSEVNELEKSNWIQAFCEGDNKEGSTSHVEKSTKFLRNSCNSVFRRIQTLIKSDLF